MNGRPREILIHSKNEVPIGLVETERDGWIDRERERFYARSADLLTPYSRDIYPIGFHTPVYAVPYP